MRAVRFNGRQRMIRVYGTDALETRPLTGVWQIGDVREFTPSLCEQHGRQCSQLGGTPCEKGAGCDCWASRFAEEHSRGHDQAPPPFDVIDVPATEPATESTSPTAPRRERTKN